MTTDIQFYATTGPYGAFSNFSKNPIQMKGEIWPTSEHYFQAQKFAGTAHEVEIREAATAMIAARMGRERKRPLRADWDAVKDTIMREALLAKFSQHPKLTALLLGTGEARIIEHTANDRYWGDGGDGSGRNRLGDLLMEVRAALRAQRTAHAAVLMWKDTTIGSITGVAWSDFPWAEGQLTLATFPEKLRAVLAWFAAVVDEDDLPDPPFPDDLMENWAVVRDDGTRHALPLPPIVDFKAGTITWR
jgi:ribA/ribD-fused uncharacterized protein